MPSAWRFSFPTTHPVIALFVLFPRGFKIERGCFVSILLQGRSRLDTGSAWLRRCPLGINSVNGRTSSGLTNPALTYTDSNGKGTGRRRGLVTTTVCTPERLSDKASDEANGTKATEIAS